MARSLSAGTCLLCAAAVARRSAAIHLDDCAPSHDAAAGAPETVLRFRIGAVGASEYWLDVEARASAALSSLDTLLRRTWLECCGHLSMFEVGPYRYLAANSRSFDPFGGGEKERSLSARIGGVFAHVGVKGAYEYDFGSTTRLTVEMTRAREGRIGRLGARVLARNNPLRWKCGVCDKPATAVCCAHETDDSPLVCASHQKKHPCQDRAFLPVVNSPRMGVCAYAG